MRSRRCSPAAPMREALAPLDEPPRLQRADAHHLRRHHAGGRARRERVAADRARHRELPHPAGRVGRRRSRRTLARVIADEKVAITAKGTAVLSPPSAINPEVMQTIARAAHRDVAGRAGRSRPCRAATPTAAGCATPASPLTASPACSAIPATAACMGATSRSACKAVYDSKEFLYRLVKRLAGP